MKHRQLGQTGRTISALGLGCMSLSVEDGTGNDGQYLDTLAAAAKLGIDFYDTSDSYGAGHNEELLGRFLVGRPRDHLVIASKLGPIEDFRSDTPRYDHRPERIAAACEASLRRLGIDALDLYYLDGRDPSVPIEDAVGAMSRLVEAGKVRWLGLSEVPAGCIRAAHAVHPITAVQGAYSLWEREPEQDILGICDEISASFVASAPLGRAFLSGSLPKTGSAPSILYAEPAHVEITATDKEDLRLSDALAAFASERGNTAVQMALAWLLSRSPEVIPIPGTRRRSRLAENAAAIDIALSSAEVATLEALFAPDHALAALESNKPVPHVDSRPLWMRP